MRTDKGYLTDLNTADVLLDDPRSFAFRAVTPRIADSGYISPVISSSYCSSGDIAVSVKASDCTV